VRALISTGKIIFTLFPGRQSFKSFKVLISRKLKSRSGVEKQNKGDKECEISLIKPAMSKHCKDLS
jgi:hypothetical protein